MKAYPLRLCLGCLGAVVAGLSAVDPPLPRIAVPAQVAGPFQRMEIAITGIPPVEHPQDPAEIAVDAVITGPDGGVQKVPAFARKDCRETGTRDKPRWEVGAEWRWQVRYAAPRPGAYQGVVTVATTAGTVRSAPFHFTVGVAPARGMVRIAPGNPQAFARDDGSAYIAVGQDQVHEYPWTSYRERLPRLAANGVNWIRLWTGHNGSFQIEGARPYEMREEAAAVLDAVLELCERHGIAAMVCMEYVRRVAYEAKSSDSWAARRDYPYAVANGGPCTTELELLTLPAAQRQFQATMRYYVARWGSSPAVFAWEFWNEMDCLNHVKRGQIVTWTDLMARWLKMNDPYRHLVTNSLGSYLVWPELWQLPSIDVVQYHDYGGRKFHGARSQVEIYAHPPGDLHGFGKPVLYSEVGLVDENWGRNPHIDPWKFPEVPKDRECHAFHEALWTPFFIGTAGGGMHWWWNELHHFDNEPHYKPFADFVADIPLQCAPMPVVAAAATLPHLTCLARGNAWGSVAWVWDSRFPWQKLVDGKAQPEPVTGAGLRLPVSGADGFAVTCSDPRTGKMLDERRLSARDGLLTIPLPTFTLDVAVKARRVAR